VDLRGAEGHVGIVGAAQTGKSTLVRTLMMSLALTHSPLDVQFYCLDFGGGGLASVAALPHVGSSATRLDRERVVRTVEEVAQLIEVREARFAQLGLESMATYRAGRARGDFQDPHGDVFLVVDGWSVLRQDFEDLEARIIELAARGLSFGVHLIASAARWADMRVRLRGLLGTKLELHLNDPAESDFKASVAAGVPAVPGRGLTSGRHHFLGALPRLDGLSRTEDLTTATKTAVTEVEAFWTGPRAPSVRMLPTRLPAWSLPAEPGSLRVCLGVDEKRLAPVWHDFSQTPHLLVFGDAETGKTNTLRMIAESLVARFPPEQVRFLLGDPARRLAESVPQEYRVGYAVDTEALEGLVTRAAVSVSARLPQADLAPERLADRDWWTGPEFFVLVDDYDLLSSGGSQGSPLLPLFKLLGASAHIGMHLVIARSTSGAMRAMSDAMLRRLWEIGAPGVLLSYPKEEGKFLGEAKPLTLPPGRAQLVTRRGGSLVQIGLAGAAQ
jgi:S-DNA-T family DNA segregation ATPase FtsK/SpoIIIE